MIAAVACLTCCAFVPGDPLAIAIERSAVPGHGAPALTVSAALDVRALHLQLRRSGCGAPRAVEATLPTLDRGEAHRFVLSQPEGHCSYVGTLDATVAGRSFRRSLQFETSVEGPPVVSALPHAFEAVTHTVRVTFNRTADHGEVETFDAGGQSLGVVADQPLGDLAPGEPLSLDTGLALADHLAVRVYDGAGESAVVQIQLAARGSGP